MKEFIDKLIERLEELKELHAELIKDGLEEDYHSGCEGMCVDIIEIINELAEEYKVSEMPTGWISVSERLPSKEEYQKSNGQFIVSDGNRTYATYFDIYDTLKFGEPTMDKFKVDKCVLAWMPLPAPYTEGE